MCIDSMVSVQLSFNCTAIDITMIMKDGYMCLQTIKRRVIKPSLDGVLLHICFCAYVLSIPSKLRLLLLCFSTSAKHTE